MAKSLTARFCESVKPTPGKQVEYPDADVRGLALRVSADGRKVWTIRYRNAEGRQCRLSLGVFASGDGDAAAPEVLDKAKDKALDLAEARRRARREIGKVADGKDPASDKRRTKNAAKAESIKTFDDLAEAFFKASESGDWRPKNKQKRERTTSDERSVYRRHVKPVLGNERLEDISRPAVRKLLRDMVGKGIGAQTNRAHAMIRATFNYAIHEERLTANPAQGFPPLATIKAKTRTLTDAEFKAWWAALEEPSALRNEEDGRVYIGRPMAIALQLIALLLQRRTEVAGMRVDELDLGQAIWIIHGDRMKGGRDHTVPLPDRAVGLIKEALALRPDPENPYVFPSPRKGSGKPLRHDSLTHAMSDALAALGLPAASPHDLRRTGSTALTSERLGVSPFIRSQVLGHSSDTGGGAAVSSAHYDVNLYIAEKRRALTSWEGLLLEIVGERARPSNVSSLHASS